MARVRLDWFKRLLTGFICVGCVGMFLALVTATPAAATTPVPIPTSTLPVVRIYGTDAIGTSIAVSQAEFPKTASAKAVVLARSDYFSDALAGGPLAASVGGPLLITPSVSQSSTLDPRVASEIQRVLPSGGTVYILGGPLALSTGIDSQLQGLGYRTLRVAGTDEYATAIAIAERLGNPKTIFEATALDFADALSAVPAAIVSSGAILLTNGDQQDPETAAYLAANPPDTRYTIGGPEAAAGADPSAIGIYGYDLWGTSAAVASWFFSGATSFGAATGAYYADALSGGVFMGTLRFPGPLLLVESSGMIPTAVSGYLSTTASTLTQGYLFGGPVAVGADVLSELEAPQPAQNAAWSGYAVGNGPFTQVTGTFSVSSLNVAIPIGFMDEWVGIDGWPPGSVNSVIQAGIEEYPNPNDPSVTEIAAWWCTFPSPLVFIPSVQVSPGDEVTVTIEQIAGNEWGITLTDDTNGQSFTTDQTYTGPGDSAEWIVENPGGLNENATFDAYSPPVTFSALGFNGAPEESLTEIVMVMSNTSLQISTPSALDSNGFNVTFGGVAPPAP